ncbi:YbaN family protein [Thiolapillus sp.]
MVDNTRNNPLKAAGKRLVPNIVLTFFGFVFVALGALGLILPVLPTTPFLLLAAACFANSSPRFHHWLLNLRVFGPLIRNWQETRSIPKRAKLLAILTIVLVGGTSVVFFIEATFLKVLVSAILLFHIFFIANIKDTELLTEKEG